MRNTCSMENVTLYPYRVNFENHLFDSLLNPILEDMEILNAKMPDCYALFAVCWEIRSGRWQIF